MQTWPIDNEHQPGRRVPHGRQGPPTLLFDEVDNIFVKGRNGDPSKTDLVGLINAGYRRGKPAYRMGGPTCGHSNAFDPFGPKVLAGIGGCLPDTDRGPLHQDPPGTQGPRHQRGAVPDTAPRGARQRARSTPQRHRRPDGQLRDAWPNLPDELDDRAQDIWEPLLAIADAAGGAWPQRARAAALALNDRRADSTEPAAIELLADIRRLFEADGQDRMFSTVIVEKLNALDEAQWAGWHRGAGFRTYDLARLLRDFGVRSKNVRIGDEVKKGYLSKWFADAWSRYLDGDEPPGATSVTAATGVTPLASPVTPVTDNAPADELF